MNTITINNTEYKVKYTIRALFIFEQITGKAFEIKTLLDNYIFFYSMILANNPDNILDWNVFIDALDSDPSIFQQLNQLVENEQKKQLLLCDNSEDDTFPNRLCKKRDNVIQPPLFFFFGVIE